MIRILMDGRAMGTRPSGIGMYIYTLVEALRKYPDLQFTLTTDVAESEEIRKLKQSGVEILESGKQTRKNFGIFSYYYFVQRAIDSIKPDIFWEGNNLCPIRMKNPGGRMYVTVYDMFPLSHSSHFMKIYPLYFRYGMKKTVRYFDKIIYDSFDCRKHTEDYFPEARKKDNFVGYIVVKKMPDIPVTDNGSFLYIGNLETRKGTDILLKAYQKYCAEGGERPLRLAGKVRDRIIADLLEETEKKTDNIQYLGYVTEEQKANEYASCHAFLFPSRAEGFGIPVVEALAYHKPVIACELAALKEIAGDSVTYFPLSADSSDCLCGLMKKDQYSADPGKCDEVVSRYSEEKIGRSYYEMIKQDLGK
jgi:glycosyltransferase involved in cell wall biosynthesis